MKVHRDAGDSAEDLEAAWLPVVVEEVVKSTSPTFVASFLSLSTCVENLY